MSGRRLPTRFPRGRVLVRLAAVLALLVVSAGPAYSESTTPAPRARAWLVRVSASSDQQQVVQVADVAGEAGTQGWSTAAPMAIGGQSPLRVNASPASPDVVGTPVDQSDPTASGTFEGGFSEAHVQGNSSRARAGFLSFAGTGFSLASETLTWDQQVQLIGQWVETNKAVFDPLNAQLASMANVFTALGMAPPYFVPMNGMSFLDAITVVAGSAEVETTAMTGMASARAAASADSVKLLGGFIEAEQVSASAISESMGGQDTRASAARFGRLTIGGVPVSADESGLTANGATLLQRAVAQEALETILAAMKSAGMTLRVAEATADGDRRGAAVLEVELVGPAGVVLISVGHAEASAASVGGFTGFAPATRKPASPAPAPASTTSTTAAPTASVEGAGIESSPLSLADTTAVPSAPAGGDVVAAAPPVRVGTGAVGRTLPASATRSLRTTYLLLALAAGAGGVLLPLLAGPPAWRPARTASRRTLGGAAPATDPTSRSDS